MFSRRRNGDAILDTRQSQKYLALGFTQGFGWPPPLLWGFSLHQISEIINTAVEWVEQMWPFTIGFLGLGALGVLVLRNKRRD